MSEDAVATLEQATRQVLTLLDALDIHGLSAMLTDDAQGVDEITRGWTRGRAAFDEYFSKLEGEVTDVRSQIRDLHAEAWGDVGLVTFVLDQTYKRSGEDQAIAAPTTIVFRQRGDGWKAALIHSVPFAD
jgi:ketosteroid isomerase-like protein